MAVEPKDLLQGYGSIPSLPMIYYRIEETINRSASSLTDVGKIVGRDPGLTTRLLKLVNSAFYGFPRRIETVSQALVVIGLNQLRDLVLATSIINLFQGIPKDLVSMESFWRHSIACGLAARLIADRRNEAHPERFFVAGMVHDVGRLIMYKKIGDLCREALIKAKTKGIPLAVAERETIGFDHCEIGRMLFKSWGLPGSLEEAVTCHHRPGKAGLYPLEAAVVHVADVLVNAFRWGTSGEPGVPEFCPSAWEMLELPEAILPDLHRNLKGQFRQVADSILGGLQ